MTVINPKHQIVESLDSMDHAQTQKVLDYIQNLMYSSDQERHQRLKRQAMKEIRQALGNSRKLNPGF